MNKANIRIAESASKFGFDINIEGHLELILPNCYKAVPIHNSKLFFEYYKLFKQYQRSNLNSSLVKEDKHFKNYDNFSDKEDLGFTKIEAFFTLLEDYQQYGLLLFEQKSTNLRSKGRTNWQKTNQKGEGILQGDSMLYIRTYYDNLRFDYSHPITILYACAMQNVIAMFDLSHNLPFRFQLLNSFENNLGQIQSYLRIYEREMYSDRQRTIFSILKQLYLNGNSFKHNHQEGNKLLYAPKLDSIWEKMLQTVLENEYTSLKNLIPKGGYQLLNTTFSGLRLIPDIIIQYQGKLLMIDAKNYYPNFDEKQGMPASSDISKQIMYKLLLSKELNSYQTYNLDQIINIFLLPADLSSETENTIKYLGKHSLNNDLKWGDIFCFHIDFEMIKNAYIAKDTSTRAELLTSILKHTSHI